MSYLIRPLGSTDQAMLWDMLYLALYVPPDVPPLPREIVYKPELAKYVQDWGKEGDMGLVASLHESQAVVGIAWLRLFQRNNQGYGYVDDETPELAIAVLPNYRNQGIGTELLTQLCDQARDRYAAISLSVSTPNPALRLYRRLGFEDVERGMDDLKMKKILRQS